MIEGVSVQTRLGQPPRPFRASATRTLNGERLALGATAGAVALLPLLSPSGPANLAPVDLLIAAAVAACLLWAGTAGHQWRFPYALPMAVFITGGALGALVGPVPGA